MTDAEFWGDLAEMLEGAETLGGCWGLCAAIAAARYKRTVSAAQARRLYKQLNTLDTQPERTSAHYFWPPCVLKPRITACRLLSCRALKRGGQ